MKSARCVEVEGWYPSGSEDFSLLVAFLLVTFSWLFRGPLLSRKTVFGPFSWLFRGFFVAFSWLFSGHRFGQNLRVLALEQSSDWRWPTSILEMSHALLFSLVHCGQWRCTWQRWHKKSRLRCKKLVALQFGRPGRLGHCSSVYHDLWRDISVAWSLGMLLAIAWANVGGAAGSSVSNSCRSGPQKKKPSLSLKNALWPKIGRGEGGGGAYTPAEPRGEKQFFCANFGRWKTLRRVPVKNVEAAREGLKILWTRFGSFFAFFLAFFKPFFVSI